MDFTTVTFVFYYVIFFLVEGMRSGYDESYWGVCDQPGRPMLLVKCTVMSEVWVIRSLNCDGNE